MSHPFWSVTAGFGRLTLDAPPSNTMTTSFFTSFHHVVKQIAGTEGLRAVIVTGSGRHFSSGADIKSLLADAGEGMLNENFEAFGMLEQLTVPVIAAIRGVCLGSALELALACHYRICADDAVLGLPETNFNLMPGIGGTGRMMKLAGTAKTVELVLRGMTFTAGDAHRWGLVDLVVPRKELLATTEQLAHSLPAGADPSLKKYYLRNLVKHYANIES